MIYFAAPLFSTAERDFNKKLSAELANHIHDEIFLPQEKCHKCGTPEEIFDTCIKGLIDSDTVIAILDGADSDSGTCWEVGYAYAENKKILGIRTDFRGSGDDEGLNCMISGSCSAVLCLFSHLEENPVDVIVDFVLKNL